MAAAAAEKAAIDGAQLGVGEQRQKRRRQRPSLAGAIPPEGSNGLSQEEELGSHSQDDERAQRLPALLTTLDRWTFFGGSFVVRELSFASNKQI